MKKMGNEKMYKKVQWRRCKRHDKDKTAYIGSKDKL